MRVNWTSKKVRSEVFHYGNVYTTSKKLKAQSNLRRVTTCTLEIDGKTIIGVVKQHYKDPDIKKVARKESFRKAVLQILDKEVRKKCWNMYIDTYPL